MALPILVALVLTYRWWIGAALIFLDDLPHNTHARGYFKQVQVHQGYQFIGIGGDGTCKCNLVRDYIGPGGVDPAHVFTGPDLTFEPWPAESVGNTQPWDFLLRGTGQSRQAGECQVYVDRYQHEYDPFDSWDISNKQRRGFKAGRLEILELEVSCKGDGV
jgi:hypothetical protein